CRAYTPPCAAPQGTSVTFRQRRLLIRDRPGGCAPVPRRLSRSGH
ncbi:MAG: hypothetical protein AVDCRST_MAG91-3605, partial [uncultured Sphingomonadaceae bacterium]